MGRTNLASLTQQICAAHWAAFHTVSLKGETRQTSQCGEEGCREGGNLEIRWWRREKGGMGAGQAGCGRAGWPCIRCINYWSAGRRQTCALETPVGEGGGGESLGRFLGSLLITSVHFCMCVINVTHTQTRLSTSNLPHPSPLSIPILTSPCVQLQPVPNELGEISASVSPCLIAAALCTWQTNLRAWG